MNGSKTKTKLIANKCFCQLSSTAQKKYILNETLRLTKRLTLASDILNLSSVFFLKFL